MALGLEYLLEPANTPSAPVFSIVGFIVRMKISANPDTSYNQPVILLWA